MSAARRYSQFYMWQPGGSFSTPYMTTQLIMAAKEMKKKILEYAVKPTPAYNSSHFMKTEQPPAFPGKKPEDLDIKDSMVFEKANPGNRKSVREVADIFWDVDPGDFASCGRHGKQHDHGWKTGSEPICHGPAGAFYRS